jgi:DNA-binding PucR family transcriptional regulator
MRATLRAYLDAGLTARDRALTIHPNTVSQRLRRIAALTGLDLARPPPSSTPAPPSS